MFGSIVTQAASAYNSTIVRDDGDETETNGRLQLLGCNIVATSRVYDPEAEDIFGSGYFSLQVHVSQKVIVESANQTLYLEVVQSVVEKGFDVVSGGQREFRNNLYENNSLFQSVISVRIQRGLTAPDPPPSSRPTTSEPTSTAPTKRPSRTPTVRPSKRPTVSPTIISTTSHPSAKPSRNPTVSPTIRPSATPSKAPSGFPSLIPSASPSKLPSLVPSTSPSTIPSILPTRNPSVIPSDAPITIPIPRSSDVNINFIPSNDGSSRVPFFNNPVVVAGILGASVVFATMSCLVCFLCFKYQRKSRRYTTFRSPVPLSQNHSNYIPGIVELGDDHRSLADTTLGDHTVGGAAFKKQQGRRPPIQRGMGSFDENSLYTTPFPIDEPEPRASAILPLSLPLPLPLTLPSVQSSLSSHLMTPLEYEESVVFPASDSVSEDSHNNNNNNKNHEGVQFPLSSNKNSNPRSNRRHPLGITPPITSLLIDTNSSELYNGEDNNTKITKIEPLVEQHPSNALGHHDFTRIPSDLDVWSCDFEDFDRGSDFYKGEEHSKSPSLSSSASTRRINNVLPSSSLMGKRDAEKSRKEGNPKPMQTTTGGTTKKKILPTAMSSSQKARDTKTRKLPHISSIALRWRTERKPMTPMPKKETNDENKATISPEEDKSQSSKKTTVSDMSKDTKTGAPTIDCLSSGIVCTLKDGVTTIDSLGNGIVNSLKEGAPKIDSFSNGIVSSLMEGAPHIESLGNGLVSSLTDMFDRMAIPKITPEGNESLCSEPTADSRNGAPSAKIASFGVVPKTISDDDSGISASPWLMEKIENTLGPISVNADLASMTSKSHKSRHTEKSKLRTIGHKSRNNNNGSEVSFGSKSSYSRFSSPDVASIMSKVSSSMSADMFGQQTPEEISFVKTSRSTLEDNIKRLESQLAALDEKEEKNDSASSVTMSSVTWASFSTISARSKTYRNRRQVHVYVPPGKLGVILADQHDGNGTTITSIKSGSPVERILKPGDKLVAVDEIAVVEMSCSQITSLIASRADQERRFTVMTTVIQKNNDEDVKDI
jgi:hypothetical protein